jgi:membrane-bound metal-dependent hydrolase YbcI (DUF457 family)
VDVFTHALASVAVARAAVSRAPIQIWIAVVVAGTIADIDELSAFLGPSTYLTWHYTYSHSIFAALIVAVLFAGLLYLFAQPSPGSRFISQPAIFLVLAIAGLLHIGLDALGSEGVSLWWPFSARRVVADWVANVDPWIIAIFLASILLPELLRLVVEEIGSKDKEPRGRLGALVGLVLVFLYIGGRASFQSNVLAFIEARSYQGELPRRAAVFPESASLLTWHGIVETDRTMHEMVVRISPGASTETETEVTLFKPEPSTMLEQARDSDSGKRFLRVARFPKAWIEKTQEGYVVQLRDLRYAVAGDTRREITVLVRVDSQGKLRENALVWVGDLHDR